MFVLSLAAACAVVPHTHTETLTAEVELPELSVDCDPSFERVDADDGSTVVSVVEAVPGGCRAAVYAQTPVVDWGAIAGDIPDAPGSREVTWLTARGIVRTLDVARRDGALAPAGTEVVLEQRLTTEHTDWAAYQQAPEVLMAAVDGVPDDRDHLLGVAHVLTDSVDLLADPGITSPHTEPFKEVQRSYDHDAFLHLVTVAAAVVPEGVLTELDGAPLTVFLEEDLRIGAAIQVRPLGSD